MVNLYKILFTLTLMLGSLISISANSWFGIWMGLEINLLSFIPLINSPKNPFNSEASMKYFITQALASTILLFSIIMLSLNLKFQNIEMILNSAIFTKMGAAPFHFWFPEVMEGLNWNNCLILLTWQKIAPMIILMYNIDVNFFLMVIILSMLISGILGFNQISIRKIMAFSSINHIAWMISSLMFLETIWAYYFVIYTIISINLIVIFKVLNTFFTSQLIMSLNQNNYIKLFFMMNFMSLGGMPPFLGFFPKWLTIQTMVTNNFNSLSVIMVILTLLTLYFYVRLMFSTLILNSNELSFFTNTIKQNYTLILNFLMLLSLFLSSILFNFI